MHIPKKQEIEELKWVKIEEIEKWVLLGGAWNEMSHRGRRKEAMKRSLKAQCNEGKHSINKKILDLFLFFFKRKEKEKERTFEVE